MTSMKVIVRDINEARLRGEDENYECLTGILDNSGIAPEERAKMLTGYGGA